MTLEQICPYCDDPATCSNGLCNYHNLHFGKEHMNTYPLDAKDLPHKAQIGDFIRIIDDRSAASSIAKLRPKCQVTHFDGSMIHFKVVEGQKIGELDYTRFATDYEPWGGEESLTKTSNIIKTMSYSIKNLFKKEPEKSFIKAGMMNEDETISSKGYEALNHILWEANKEELKKIADLIIAEEKTK